MVFSSIVFMFYFLPIVLCVYYLIPSAMRNMWLLLASLFFYAWGETFYITIMLLSIAFNYAFGLLLARFQAGVTRKWVLGVAVAGNLLGLIAFKYANFLVDTLNGALALIHLPPLYLAPIHLPIGISFFTFHAMSYIIDIYRGKFPAQRNIFHLALYISLFSQLVAGPIIQYNHMANQLGKRFVNAERFAKGIRRFSLGLAKKVLIANMMAIPADEIFSLPASQYSPGLAWLGICSYTLQIYFDFSGYSDMAVGLGHMFGFHFLENFQWPYISRSIREFWRRWHISLSTWFRDYLYISLGGNRLGAFRTFFNLYTVFLLCGFWHGASWNFIFWGGYHGTFLVLEHTRFGAWLDAAWRPIRHLYTILVVMIGWVFFRADTFGGAFAYLGAMAGRQASAGTLHPLGYYLQTDYLIALAFGIVCCLPLGPWCTAMTERIDGAKGSAMPLLRGVWNAGGVVFPLALLLLCSFCLSSGTHNPFIYFRF